MRYSLVIFAITVAVACVVDAVDNLDSSVLSSDRRLSVLLATLPLAGHSYPMLALGEELARRGHNVTFCTARNWQNLSKKATDKGMNFLDAGNFPFDEETTRQIANDDSNMGFPDLSKLRLLWKTIVDFLHQESDLGQWDIIVVSTPLQSTVPCLAHQAGVPVVEIVSRSYHPHLQPEWPFPSDFSTQTDELTFTNRLRGVVQHWFMVLGYDLVDPMKLPSVNPVCKEVFHSTNPQCIEFPCLVLFPIGLEFPRTSTPLENYVGPIMPKHDKGALSKEMSEWLTGKPDKSVVYVGMGSLVTQTHELALAIVNGLQSTRYSVIWSLRKTNRYILDGLTVDPTRFFISDWVPQTELLQHPSIAMAIIHGGSGSVTESLYYGIPIIVLSFGMDRTGNAARVQAANMGITLQLWQLTAENIKMSVEAIELGDYHEKAQQMRKIMIQAGGVDRASELVEFYADVGYQHLVPAYVKYKWSWVQYYNVDVKLVLCVLLAGLVYIAAKFFKCCCSCCCCCCRHKEKTKAE